MSYYENLKKKFGYKEKSNEKTIVDALMEVPNVDKKGLDVPTTEVFSTNHTHQLDLLFLPDDDGYRFCLSVVDLALPRYVGAEPLKGKTAKEVLKALLKIYKDSKYLTVPKRLEMDNGGEFKGEFKAYFEKLNVDMAYKKAGRSRQQSCVEALNFVLGHFLFKRMLANEIAMKGEELNADWVHELPELIDLINYTKNKNSMKKKRNGKPSARKVMSHDGILPVGKPDSYDVLPIGTKVRVVADEPVTIQGIKEHGKDFRATDIRWELPIRTIKQLSLRPNQPPMYLVEGIDNVAYTKQQLQVVKPNEKPPNKESVTKFIIEKLLDKRNEKGRVQYLVKWKHFDDPKDNTWNYISDIPKHFITEYNKTKK